ncbi:PolC-type DNA polymerase III [Defluviitoga tunisiensis]|uniref:DNA polymerase III PolC-type n=1 Tax=Defluviitoga tunisiensis TaxID=1006576 RepID=A0A0C7P4U0_DEFTU|nr:PolC-type DNA polymerase III [Defluviitoga tunisiensis]CEP78849.1 DNA polymerase III PolC-type [Defluviitoga tunisiensis]
MKYLNDFFMEYLGFIPFKIEGNISFLNNYVEVILNKPLTDISEEELSFFLKRLLKKDVSINFLSNNSPDFIVKNWEQIIHSHPLRDYLRFLTPTINEERLIFKTPYPMVKARITNFQNEFEELLYKHLGKKLSYDILIDETLKPNLNIPMSSYEAVTLSHSTSVNSEDLEIILGKEFKKIPMPLNILPMNEGTSVVVSGKIFYIEHNERGPITSIYISDKKSSAVIKAFSETAITLFKNLALNDVLLLEGTIFYDNYIKEFAIKPINLIKLKSDPFERKDTYPQKRVELHLHSKLSSMEGLLDIDEIVNTAKKWGHKAIAITDVGVVQSIPEFYDKAVAKGIKPIFGMEAFVVDEFINIVTLLKEDKNIEEAEYVVFDLETTGLEPALNEIIEIGAVKLKDMKIVSKFHRLVKPKKPVSQFTTNLTGITNEMLEKENPIEVVLPEFLSFIEDAILVAHNADFDYRFLREWVAKVYNEHFEQTYIDTLALSKSLLNLKGYSLDKVVDELNLGNFEHHRAHEDANVTALVFIKLIEMAKNKNIKKLSELEKLKKFIDYRRIRPTQMTILVKNKTGLKNLYKLISNSHVKYFYRVPRILKSELSKMRNGLLIGSSGEEGEIIDAYLRGASHDEIIEIAKFYDYLEIMPINSLEISSKISNKEIIKMYKSIYNLGKELNMPVVMVSNAHYLDKEDVVFLNTLKFAEKRKPTNSLKYLRTTDEMIEEAMKIFEDKEIAENVVINNPNNIADQIDLIQPLSKKLNPPTIENAEEEVKETALKNAHEIYGNPLPKIVEDRLNKELNSIIKHGYAVLYLIAQRIVNKSIEDGYLVGSRGSVGSSFVATLLGITEINPLPPHYVCPNCKKSEFIEKGNYGSGYDLPRKKCEVCGTEMTKNGQNIPFETFMGFEGDKIPDIDLNFSGDYQSKAHKYIEQMFGEDHVYRAGTISTIAERTAYEFSRKYCENVGILKNSEIQRIASAITGVKRTTGQHPGGLMIVPKELEIYDFTPIQFPANDSKSGVQTTHFDYHVIHDDLVKLDALGHDDPTFLKMLKDLTGIDPMKIPMDDKKTLSIFSSTKELNIDLKNELGTTVGTLGIPEFGTTFVRRMLEDTRPKSFAELVRISGLSHGTDVWSGIAKTWIDTKEATLEEVISCRDDIMNYLLLKGAPPKEAFSIMEKVRKGKGINESEEELMRNLGVPEWFITSCKKIKYLFPKAHAAAYVSMAFRIAWYKVYYPLAFYATYFTIKGDEFNLKVIFSGKEAIKKRIYELRMSDLDVKKKSEMTNLELVLEMMLRGFSFKMVDLYKSESKEFLIVDNSLLVPFTKIPNLGEKAAEKIIRSRSEEFKSIEDFVSKTGCNKTNVQTLKELGVLRDLPETNQISLFGG